MSDARSITKALGGRWCGDYGMARCPAHDDHDPSLSIKDGEKELVVKCHAGCNWRDVKDELRKLDLINSFLPGRSPQARPRAPRPNQEEEDRKKIKAALGLWDKAVPLQGTLAWKYFTERRQLHVGALDDLSHCLRWYEGIHAVIAVLTDPRTGEKTGTHRTYLNPDGTNRRAPDGKHVRTIHGRRGVIKLSPDDQVGVSLGICEGIEDGLRILLGGWSPVWSATCAGGIERFPVLPAVECLTIFADDGDPGIKAAEICAERWLTARRKAVIVLPKDYCNA